MASPQKENGYTPISNELIEKLAGAAALSARELRVLLVIMRKTWGWKKKKDRISLGQVATLTGIGRQHISTIVASLVKRGYLLRDIPVGGKGIRTYEIGKDYDVWEAPTYPQLFPQVDNTLPAHGNTHSRPREGKRGGTYSRGRDTQKKETIQKGPAGTFLRKSGDKPKARAHTDGPNAIGDLLKRRHDRP